MVKTLPPPPCPYDPTSKAAETHCGHWHAALMACCWCQDHVDAPGVDCEPSPERLVWLAEWAKTPVVARPGPVTVEDLMAVSVLLRDAEAALEAVLGEWDLLGRVGGSEAQAAVENSCRALVAAITSAREHASGLVLDGSTALKGSTDG